MSVSSSRAARLISSDSDNSNIEKQIQHEPQKYKTWALITKPGPQYIQRLKASTGHNDPNRPPFFVKLGQGFFSRSYESAHRWYWLHFLIFVGVTLLIMLPLVYVAVPTIIQSHINNVDVTVEGVTVSNPTPQTFGLALNITVNSHTHWTPTVSPFNVSLNLADVDVPVLYIAVPKFHATRHATLNISQTVEIANQTALGEFIERVLHTESFEIVVRGHAHVKLGALPPKKNANIRKYISLTGMNGLTNLTPSNVSFSLQEDAQGDNFFADIALINPSEFTVDVGNITIQEDASLSNGSLANYGVGHVDNVQILKGTNNYRLRAGLDVGGIFGLVTKPPYCQTGMLNISLLPNNATYNNQVIPWLVQGLESLSLAGPVNLTHALHQAPKCLA